MIDWEEIAGAVGTDELKEAKLWLFQENIRLENARKELAESQEKFTKERVQFRRELEEMNRRTLQERKRLKEENLFFEKKLAILQDGFRQLDEDRKTLERQRQVLAEQRKRSIQYEEEEPLLEETVKRLFDGVNNPLALRKRHRDLVKIFHPDNLFGDAALVQMINKEYVRRKEDA
ncbi:MAG: hypothetical protein NC517_02290 [Firmicutes bacterium]|nr:hypothetical protein [Bacillota bacterium]